MAHIVGGLAVSTRRRSASRSITGKQQEPAWAPIFESFQPVRAWLRDKRPQVLFYVFNDHVTSFFFDHYSAFALGVDDRYQVADEGGGARAAARLDILDRGLRTQVSHVSRSTP
jgi:gallate dioxygenase